MKFMLLLQADEAGWADYSPEEMRAAMGEFAAFNRSLAESGVLLHGEQLMSAAKTRTVSSRRGELRVTDGPFSESKEQLGGYYVLDVENIEEAVRWAERCPAVHYGWVEVRPLAPRPA